MNALATAERVPTYGQLLERATNVAELNRCSVETVEVACLVMDWQIALSEDGSAYAFETATLLEIAVELVLVRGLVASEALYADLARMPSGRLTTSDAGFDAWFAGYGLLRSGLDRSPVQGLTGREQALSNDIDVIVTPFCLPETMIEHTFCHTASLLVTGCDRAPTAAIHRFGLTAYRDAGRLVAQHGVDTVGGSTGSEMVDVARADLDDLFVAFALSIGDIDQPPLACVVLDERYRSWFFDVFLPECCPAGLTAVAEATYEGAVDWLWQLRAAGGCCSSGCST